MGEVKIKKINYRRAVGLNGTTPDLNFNLEDLFKRAHDLVPNARKRELQDKTVHALTHICNKQGCLCGRLALYEEGKKIPLIDMNDDGVVHEEIIEPKDSKGRPCNLREQELFFAIRENHVTIMASRELTINDFRDFLIWLIHTKARLEPKTIIELNNPPSKKAIEKLNESEITAFHVGGNLFKEDTTKSQEVRAFKEIKMNPPLLACLETLLLGLGMGADPVLKKLTEAEDPGKVYVGLNIKYMSRKKKDSQELMQALANSFGKIEDLDTTINLKNKGKISGDELSISDSRAILARDGILSTEDALSKLTDWLVQSIKSGIVL